MAQVQGTCAPGFEKVRSLFQAFLNSGEEIGASLAVNLDGETVVDLYGGHADAELRRPWVRDTLVPLASSTKMVTALAALMLVDRGAVASVRDPVVCYWPEFGARGKDAVEVRHLLAHTSGVAGWDDPISMEEVCGGGDHPAGSAAAKLAAQAPWWEPGTASAYHAWTYGHLLGEVVRRVTGLGLKQFVAQEITAPLGADFQIGLLEKDEPRVSEFIVPPPPPAARSGGGGGGGDGGGRRPGFKPGPLFMKVIANPTMAPGFGKTRTWRDGEVGASNGYGNARALNTILCNITLAGAAKEDDDNGDEDDVDNNHNNHNKKKKKRYLLSKPTVDLIFEEQVRGVDLAIGQTIRWGIGFALRGDGDTWVDDRLPAGRIAYWGGSGGSLGIMDVDRRLTITYAMNLSSTNLLGNDASTAYIKAIYEALGVEI